MELRLGRIGCLRANLDLALRLRGLFSSENDFAAAKSIRKQAKQDKEKTKTSCLQNSSVANADDLKN